MNKNLTIIIPASGLTRRMKSFGPKSLINLGDSTILSRQLRIIKKRYPEAEIILVSGFQSEKISKLYLPGIKVIENIFYSETNVAYSIKCGIDVASNDNILIIYGDLVFNENILNFPLENSSIVYDSNNNMKSCEVGVTIANQYAIHFSYALPNKWAQIAYLAGTELQLFKSLYKDKYKKYFGFELLNLILMSGGQLQCFEPQGMKVIDVDNSQDIEIAKRIANENTL